MKKVNFLFTVLALICSTTLFATDDQDNMEMIGNKLNTLKLEKIQAEALVNRMVKIGRIKDQEGVHIKREIAGLKEDDVERVRQEALEKITTTKSVATK